MRQKHHDGHVNRKEAGASLPWGLLAEALCSMAWVLEPWGFVVPPILEVNFARSPLVAFAPMTGTLDVLLLPIIGDVTRYFFSTARLVCRWGALVLPGLGMSL